PTRTVPACGGTECCNLRRTVLAATAAWSSGRVPSPVPTAAFPPAVVVRHAQAKAARPDVRPRRCPRRLRSRFAARRALDQSRRRLLESMWSVDSSTGNPQKSGVIVRLQIRNQLFRNRSRRTVAAEIARQAAAGLQRTAYGLLD